MSVPEKITSEILPQAVKEGKFGQNIVKFVEYRTDESFTGTDQYSSIVFFGDVILESDKGQQFTQSIVIKALAGGRLFEAGEKYGFDLQLYNELLFYTEVLPLFRECDPTDAISKLFPKCFYAHAVRGDAANDILILENVQKRGFKLSPYRTFNDYNHIKLTLEWLGKFHALSLVCKKKFPEKFKRVVSRIVEWCYTEKRLANPNNFCKVNCKRGILPLQNDPSYRDKLKDLLALVEETDVSMAKLATPIEPFAVICHGDFFRNNMFYKYDSNNIPYEVMFFDLATMRYASPIIDFSYYLFINTSPEIKVTHFKDILRTYYEALTSNPNLDPVATPTFQDFQQDYRRRGFYGYAVASFIFPMMLAEDLAHEEWSEMSIEEMTELRIRSGGQVATDYLTQAVKHMIDHNFDFKYILD